MTRRSDSPFKGTTQHGGEQLTKNHAGAAVRGRLVSPHERPARCHLTRLTLRVDNKIVILRIGDIDTIESAGNYVAVHVGKESHIVRETLSALETQLDPKRFLRISRSAIVNLDRVKELLPMFKGEHVMVLQNGKHLAMTLGLRAAERALKFS